MRLAIDNSYKLVKSKDVDQKLYPPIYQKEPNKRE